MRHLKSFNESSKPTNEKNFKIRKKLEETKFPSSENLLDSLLELEDRHDDLSVKIYNGICFEDGKINYENSLGSIVTVLTRFLNYLDNPFNISIGDKFFILKIIDESFWDNNPDADACNSSDLHYINIFGDIPKILYKMYEFCGYQYFGSELLIVLKIKD